MAEEFIKWSEEFETGIRLIDNDHRELVAIINEISRSIERRDLRKSKESPGLAGVMIRLNRYATEHFAREETVMRQYRYPDLKNHQEKHRMFRRHIYALAKVCAQSPEIVDLDRLRNFLRDWLVAHICKTDRDYVPYISATGSYRDAEAAKRPDRPDIGHLTTVSVGVPANKEVLLRQFAELLRKGDPEALALEPRIEAMIERATFDISYAEACHLASDFLTGIRADAPDPDGNGDD